MNTEQLIARLTQNVEPVRPLRTPSVRASRWLAGAAVYLGVLVVIMSPRDDLAARMGDPRFMVEQAAALLTVLTAAIAAFALTIPGTRRTIAWLPVAAGGLWLAAVSAGALRDGSLARPGDVLFQTDWGCV